MAPMQAPDVGELEFFGIKLKVRNPRLAALLNSDVNDDVRVIRRRMHEAVGNDDDARVKSDVTAPVLHADDSVVIRLDENDAL
jgi:hypothetical protein